MFLVRGGREESFLALSIVCEDGTSLLQIHRIYGANPVNEKLEIYRGSAATGQKIHTETGKSSAYLESVIELCVVKTSHTFVLSDVSVLSGADDA